MWGRNVFLMGLAGLLLLVVGCNSSENRAPKPRGYFRIDLPKPQYISLPDGLPYSFEVSHLARLQRRSETNWINLVYPTLNASIHLTYRPIDSNLGELIDESRDLAFVHAEKADGIRERVFSEPSRDVFALMYEIEGNTASQLQFVATDSVSHFLRGALYFNAEPNFDSVQPVLNFFREDVIHLIESLKWHEVQPI